MGDVRTEFACAECGRSVTHDTRDHGIWLGLGSEVQCPHCGAVHEGVLSWVFRKMEPLTSPKPPKQPYEFKWPIGQERAPKNK